MRVLIRDNEIYKETEWSPFTVNHLLWHTAPRPQGDGYALAEDCPVSDPEPQDFDITEVQIPGPPSDDPDDPPAEPTTHLVAVLNTARYEARKAQEVGEADPAPIEAPAAEGGASAEPPATIVVDGVEYVRQ